MALTTAEIQNAYVAFFNRPADVAGLTYWSSYAGSSADLLNTFAQSAEYKSLYSGMNSTQLVNAVYQNLFGRAPEIEGLTYWVTQLDQGKLAIGNIADAINKGAQGTDAIIITNKVAAATAFTDALDTTAEVVAYAGLNSTGSAAVKSWLAAVTSDSATLTNATSTATLTSITTTVLNNVASTGSTFTLTKGVDIVKGTSGNDTIIADNTAAAADKQLTAADQIDGGAGTDTLKVYLAAADTVTGQPTLTSIENVWINGGAVTAYTAATGTTGLTVEAPVAGTAGVYTVNGQAVTLKDVLTVNNTALTTTIVQAATATATSQAITLNGVKGQGTGVHTLDASGAKIVTLDLTATGSASTVTLANTGAGIKTLNIAGDKDLTLTENAATAAAITKIDASKATGKVSVDTSAAAKSANFAFTGGAGDDTLTLRAGDLTVLTAGSQLDGGAGKDKLVINDTTLTAGIYTAINAAKGFEVLGLGTTAAVVDASQLTSIKSFETGVATTTINNLAAGSSVALTAATTAVNLGAAIGNTAVDITVGSATAAGFTTTALNTTGLTNITLTANGTSKQTIATLGNSDNTLLTIKGAADLEITNALAGTTTGSKVDASALTGKLTVTGSSMADVLIGGSNDDVLTAGTGADTLTGGAGKDKFVVIGSGITAATADTITDFVTKVDTLDFTGAVAGSSTNYSEALAAVADFAAALAAANVALDGTVLYNAQQVGSDVWVFADNAGTGSATEVVKLTGVSLAGIEFGDIVA